MIGEILSQDEINALLGMVSEDASESDNGAEKGSLTLTDEEIDAIGEVGNISMGTSATTLFTLLNQKVSITTPRVTVLSWDEFVKEYPENIIAINVDYKEGLTGANLLLLKDEDVKKITDIMMGGDGTNTTGELNEIHLSAIAEAMNQMVGSASTSMSQMLNMKIDINPPQAYVANFAIEDLAKEIDFADEAIVQVAFDMKIGSIIDSEIMQIIPIRFAKEMVSHLMHGEEDNIVENVKPINTITDDTGSPRVAEPSIPTAPVHQPSAQAKVPTQVKSTPTHTSHYQPPEPVLRDVDVQRPQFPSFDTGAVIQQKENMDIIMDVPLEVTVELGRASKKIKEILEFSPGTIIELDRLAGEPIDILVNGKFVAQGEVVVIDENFGIRITEIVNTEHRI